MDLSRCLQTDDLGGMKIPRCDGLLTAVERAGEHGTSKGLLQDRSVRRWVRRG